MSLSWDVADVKDKTKVFEGEEDDRKLTVRAHATMFVTMLINMGDITEKNCAEFYQRVRMVEAVCGPIVHGPLTTFEDIQGLIGLHTNVFPAWSRKRFLTHISKIALEKAMARHEAAEVEHAKLSAGQSKPFAV